jgi:hypothetical protein
MIFVMTSKDISPVTPERWLSNILDVLSQIADRERQEGRWLAADAFAWEHPEELINSVDDVVFEGFLEHYTATFSKEQREAAFGFRNALNNYCELTPQNLDPAETLADPRWHLVRQKASAFVAAFSKKWPSAHATT